MKWDREIQRMIFTFNPFDVQFSANKQNIFDLSGSSEINKKPTQPTAVVFQLESKLSLSLSEIVTTANANIELYFLFKHIKNVICNH